MYSFQLAAGQLELRHKNCNLTLDFSVTKYVEKGKKNTFPYIQSNFYEKLRPSFLLSTC